MNGWKKWTRRIGLVLRYAVATVSLAIVFYGIFALVFSTDEEGAAVRRRVR